jgi:hypothetical protein
LDLHSSPRKSGPRRLPSRKLSAAVAAGFIARSGVLGSTFRMLVLRPVLHEWAKGRSLQQLLQLDTLAALASLSQ